MPMLKYLFNDQKFLKTFSAPIYTLEERIQKQPRTATIFLLPHKSYPTAPVLPKDSNQCPILTVPSCCYQWFSNQMSSFHSTIQEFQWPWTEHACLQKDFLTCAPQPSIPQSSTQLRRHFPSRSERKAPKNGGEWKYQNKTLVANHDPHPPHPPVL